MKYSLSVALLSLLTTGVFSAPHVQLQNPPTGAPADANAQAASLGMTASMPKPRKAYKIQEMPPQTGIPGTKRVQMHYGPYKLRSVNSTEKVGNFQSMDRGGTAWTSTVDDDFPADVMVLTVKSEMQTPEFVRASIEHGIYNHHNVFMHLTDPGDLYGCEHGNAKEQMKVSMFGGGATEVGATRFYDPSGKVKSGYYLPKDRTIINSIDVVNYNAEDKDVFTLIDIEYIPGHQDGFLQAYQQRVDPGICGGVNGGNLHVPKAQSNFTVETNDIVALKSGWLLSTRGHMHDGGVNIELLINDKRICDSVAQYGGEGHASKQEDGKVWETIRESSLCDDPVYVKKGDKIKMIAHYDTIKHPSRKMGGMSAMKMRQVVRHVLGEEVALDDAEQMALFITFFADDASKV